ncbi:MAG: hypothetical protein EBR71_12785, partial [Planctomycetes bacterium]|nr:hypothetical protein [Planctomycetota bacterium]
MQARAAHRAELGRIEDTWFDNVKAGVQGVDAAALETARSRRALQRAMECTRGGGMLMPDIIMSRWLRVDLDKAADALSPAGQASCAAPLQAWRSQMLTELATTQARMDDMAKMQMSMMTYETVTDDQGNTNVRMGMSVDQTQSDAL